MQSHENLVAEPINIGAIKGLADSKNQLDCHISEVKAYLHRSQSRHRLYRRNIHLNKKVVFRFD